MFASFNDNIVKKYAKFNEKHSKLDAKSNENIAKQVAKFEKQHETLLHIQTLLLQIQEYNKNISSSLDAKDKKNPLSRHNTMNS